MADPRDKWTINHFSLANLEGSLPTLLRRLAEEVEALGDVDVQDITFGSEVTADEPELHMTVYYHRERSLSLVPEETENEGGAP
jgi:hypothetical protein